MVSKKDFFHESSVRGKGRINLLEGLELHCNVLSPPEQQQLIDWVWAANEEGQRGRLMGRTYSAPRKWMPGKGRITMQFGCCYNYATDSEGRPPGETPNPQLLLSFYCFLNLRSSWCLQTCWYALLEALA